MIDPKTGEKRKAIMTSFTMKRISSCDFPAQEGAVMAIMKRKLPEEFKNKGKDKPKKGEKGYKPEDVEKRMALTTPVAGHSHLIVGLTASADGVAELRAGKTSWVDGHSHDWVMDDAGNIILADTEGHTHGIGVLVSKSELAEASASFDETKTKAEKAADAIGTSMEATMPDGKKAAELVAVSPEDHDAVTKRAERAEAVVGLSGAHRAHFDSLEKSKQGEFLTLGPEQRDALITEAAAADKVVYKADDGSIYKKSDDVRLVALAKKSDEDRQARVAAETKVEKSDLTKRAEMFKNLPGTVEERSALLKAIDGIKDEKARDEALKTLKVADAALGKNFVEIGDKSTPNADVDADTVVKAIAKTLQTADPKLTDAQAIAKAFLTEEGEAAILAEREMKEGK
jgi:hypothetical protein